MPAHRRVIVCLAVTFGLLFAAAPAHAYSSPSPMVDQINAVRAAYGLHTLRYSRTLSRSSLSYGYHQMRTGQFSHASRIRASSRFSKLGEILALTQGWEINRTRTIILWMFSPTHRAVMLSPAFRYVGAARVHGYLGGRPATIWTVQFGKMGRPGSD